MGVGVFPTPGLHGRLVEEHRPVILQVDPLRNEGAADMVKNTSGGGPAVVEVHDDVEAGPQILVAGFGLLNQVRIIPVDLRKNQLVVAQIGMGGHGLQRGGNGLAYLFGIVGAANHLGEDFIELAFVGEGHEGVLRGGDTGVVGGHVIAQNGVQLVLVPGGEPVNAVGAAVLQTQGPGEPLAFFDDLAHQMFGIQVEINLAALQQQVEVIAGHGALVGCRPIVQSRLGILNGHV